MNIVFAGSPDFVFPVLPLLVKEHNLLAIITNARAKAGRGKKEQSSPLLKELKDFCEASPTDEIAKALKAVPIFEVNSLDTEFSEKVKLLNADLLVCYAFGKIFTESFLSLFRFGGINVHPSLLPRWRGATPVPAAILAGDEVTGVTIQTLAKKMDSGQILAQSSYQMQGSEDTATLLNILTDKALPCLQKVLTDFPAALQNAKTQNESEATYCTKITRTPIDWSKSALEISRTIRALTPNPKAFSTVNGERITILKSHVYDEKNGSNQITIAKTIKELSESGKLFPGKVLTLDKGHGILVQTGKGIIAIERLQREGKKELPFKDFLNGYPNFLECHFEIS